MNEICCCSFHISTIFTVHLYFAHLCGSCLQLFYSVIAVQGTSFFGLLIIIIIIIIAVGAHKRYKNNFTNTCVSCSHRCTWWRTVTSLCCHAFTPQSITYEHKECVFGVFFLSKDIGWGKIIVLNIYFFMVCIVISHKTDNIFTYFNKIYINFIA